MNSVQILERLASFPTVSRDSNLDLIDFVQSFLSECGVESRLYPDSSARKANLYACVGPTDRGGILLSGHTDVVPVDGQPWSTDPFRLSQRSGRLYARGSTDMKGFIACALGAAKLASQRKLRIPLQLAFSYDEEIGCVGVRSLIDDMESWTHRPEFCIVGEPTSLRTAVGHKGKTALLATCRGKAAHSAYPHRGVNAIHLAADLIGRIRERQSLIEQCGLHDPAYETPYSTLHVGVIHGGSALNIIPSLCELELEIRNLPADDSHAMVAALRADAATLGRSTAGDETGIDLKVLNEYPGLSTPADSAVVALAAALTGQRDLIHVGFGSEAGLFSGRLGIPTVVCGPGSIEQAHKPDEFVDLDQMQRCDSMMAALLNRLA